MRNAAFVFMLLCAAPLHAQVEVVAAIKADVVARGISVAGPCGAFQITKRVAWALRGTGVGLLDKPAGNNCEGYSIDYLVFPDGSGRDILGDGGGENTPAWAPEPNEPAGAFAGRWRAPFDPGDVVVPPAPSPVPPPPADSTLDQTILDELRAHEAKEAAFREAVADKWKKFGIFLAKYAPAVLGAVFAGRASK